MMEELQNIITTIKNPELKSVIDSFFDDKKFAKEFKLAPAAMYKHHGWISGLFPSNKS